MNHDDITIECNTKLDSRSSTDTISIDYTLQTKNNINILNGTINQDFTYGNLLRCKYSNNTLNDELIQGYLYFDDSSDDDNICIIDYIF